MTTATLKKQEGKTSGKTLKNRIFLYDYGNFKKASGKASGKTVKNRIFLYDYGNFNKNWEWRGRLFHFIVDICKLVSRTLKHKLQAAVPVLSWYFFNLNEMTIANKGKCFFNFNS